jgi:hypothetical protein
MTIAHQPRRSALAAAATVGITMLLLVASACSSDSTTSAEDTTTTAAATGMTGTAPQLADPVATATELLTTWLETLKAGESVADLIAPNFQLQRADGSAADRDQYLANPATVSEYTFGDTIVASQSGNTLSVRWSVKVTEVINGQEYVDIEAPRITAFEWTGTAWQIVAYGNFNPAP